MRLVHPTTQIRGIVAAALGLTLSLAAVAGVSAQATPAPAIEQLKNATYPTPYRASKSITLVDGKFDSAAERVNMTFVDATYGTLNGTPVAVVHTATNTGGSGVFSEFYIVDASLKPFGPAFLGDRLKDVRFQIVENRVLVDMITQGPGEPLCCGTTPERQNWEVQAGAFVRTLKTSPQIQPPRPANTGNAGLEAQRTSAGGLGALPTVLAMLALAGVLAARQATQEAE